MGVEALLALLPGRRSLGNEQGTMFRTDQESVVCPRGRPGVDGQSVRAAKSISYRFNKRNLHVNVS